MLYKIQPTAPAGRLATRQVGYDWNGKSAVQRRKLQQHSQYHFLVIPRTSEVIWGQICFISFESPYMTSYASIDTFSLSRTVFEIFDFTLFRVWLWPSTFIGDPRSNIFILFESPYLTSYLSSMDSFSISRTVFEFFHLNVLGFDLDLWSLKVIWGGNVYTIRKLMHGFLSNSHWHFF